MNDKIAVLKQILRELNNARIEHSLGGSDLLYFLGLVENVGDWDILTSASSDEIKKIFNKYDLKKVGVNETYHSDFLYRLFINGVKVELIGNFRYKINNDLIEVSSRPHSLIEDIPLASPEDWIKFYRMMGKSNNVSLLENWLRNKALY